MTDPALAAVLFETEPVDCVLRRALAGQGGRVLGWLQGDEDGEMVLTALRDGARRVISQHLGAGSKGCRLDPAALAEVAGWLAADLADPPDLLVLNRFGRMESEGGGLRAVLEQALSEGVPVLVPVHRRHLEYFRDYAGGMAAELPCAAGPIADWLARAVQPRR